MTNKTITPPQVNQPKGSGSLEFDGLLAAFHAIVWATAEDDDPDLAYDEAGNVEAKKLQAMYRALQSELTKARELTSNLRTKDKWGVVVDEKVLLELESMLSNQSAPADKECVHRFMSLADDPRRCADCDAVEMHDKPVVRLELVRSGISEGLHIRVWENLGNLWPGVHMLYLGPAEQPAPVADGTTTDKYKAELYDEVWQMARDMGFANVTDALTRLDDIDGIPRLNPIKQ